MADQIHVLTHVDLIPPNTEAGLAAIERYVGQLRADPAVIDVQILQQLFRKNHIELAIVFTSQEAYEANLGAPYTLAFREELHPLIGAPFDDRLHVLIPSGS
jgi:quinol monooxygenase YgiN